MSKLHFLRALTPQQKITLLTETTHKLFLEGKRIQIQAPSDAALTYIDELLWVYKPEAFLPHAIASSQSLEPIVLTKEATNLNKADILIHLLPGTPPSGFAEVYDLLDETTSEKQATAEAKIKALSI